MKELGIFILISNFTKGEWFVLFTNWDIGRCKIKEINDDEKSFVRKIHRKCNISKFLFTKRSLVKSLCPYRSMKFRH